MFANLVCVLLPALFMLTQVYTVVPTVPVGTSNTCWKGEGRGLKAKLFLYHCTVGMGFPLALQYITATLPTLVS